MITFWLFKPMLCYDYSVHDFNFSWQLCHKYLVSLPIRRTTLDDMLTSESNNYLKGLITDILTTGLRHEKGLIQFFYLEKYNY